MNCTDIDKLKDDYLKGQLPVLQHTATEQHLLECESCHASIAASRKILEALKPLSAPEPRKGYVDGLFKEVRKQYPEKSSRHFVAGFATAMAAGFALWFVSTLFEVQQQTLPALNEMTVSLNTTQSVRLMFDAPDDYQRITLSLKLPDNIELKGYAGQSEISWDTSFSKGPNILTLPIKAITKGSGELIARVSYGDKLKAYHLVIKTADNGVVNYQVQPYPSA